MLEDVIGSVNEKVRLRERQLRIHSELAVSQAIDDGVGRRTFSVFGPTAALKMELEVQVSRKRRLHVNLCRSNAQRGVSTAWHTVLASMARLRSKNEDSPQLFKLYVFADCIVFTVPTRSGTFEVLASWPLREVHAVAEMLPGSLSLYRESEMFACTCTSGDAHSVVTLLETLRADMTALQNRRDVSGSANSAHLLSTCFSICGDRKLPFSELVCKLSTAVSCKRILRARPSRNRATSL